MVENKTDIPSPLWNFLLRFNGDTLIFSWGVLSPIPVIGIYWWMSRRLQHLQGLVTDVYRFLVINGLSKEMFHKVFDTNNFLLDIGTSLKYQKISRKFSLLKTIIIKKGFLQTLINYLETWIWVKSCLIFTGVCVTKVI